MTENEAKKTMEVLRHNLKVEHMTKDMWDGSTKEEVDTYIETFDCYSQAIQALEEIQQYRAIGTVEECKAMKTTQRMIEKSNFCLEQYRADTETAYQCGYNKAIDDFVEKLKTETFYGYQSLEDYFENSIECVAVEDVLKISEVVRKGGVE